MPAYLARASAGLLALGVAFAAGLATENWRPFGTDFHRRQAVDLARRMGEMHAARCCHD